MKLLSSSGGNAQQAGMQVTLLLYLDCNGDTEKTALQEHCNNTISMYLRGKATALCLLLQGLWDEHPDSTF